MIVRSSQLCTHHVKKCSSTLFHLNEPSIYFDLRSRPLLGLQNHFRALRVVAGNSQNGHQTVASILPSGSFAQIIHRQQRRSANAEFHVY